MIRRLAQLVRPPVAPVAGTCDGLDGEGVHGWAWQPGNPDVRVEIGQWVDGGIVARTIANLPRSDLAAAGIGDGCYGWRMPVRLDPAKAGAQKIEIRDSDGGLLANGSFQLVQVPAPRMPPVAGSCDRLDGDGLHGWAWLPAMPHVRLQVEQWVDGVMMARAPANLPRGDLAATGFGDGSYGWRMPLMLDPTKEGPQTVEVRVQGGEALPGGAFELCNAFVAAGGAAEATAALRAAGRCDARDGIMLRGWAWRPEAPEQRVIVEQWVDGALAAHTVADQPRADLFHAAIGDGSYGWTMPLALDMAKAGPQSVALRIRGAGVLAHGELIMSVADIQAELAPSGEAGPPDDIEGRCDGLKGTALYGWARNLLTPDEPVEVELWVGGTLAARCTADIFRPDLRGDRIGHGRYGWRLPVELPQPGETVRIEIRAKNGPVLTGGIMDLGNDLSLDDPANAALRAFVEAVLNPAAKPSAPCPTMFLLYCPPAPRRGRFSAAEYDDYAAAMRSFAPALSSLGAVEIVGSMAAARAVCAERRAQGWHCILFSFGSPRHAPLHAPCPIVPVFAWAFPTIPTGTADGDPRSDWRRVLRFAGRAITFSRFAAAAVRAAMGADFPVAVIPPPPRTPSGTAVAGLLPQPPAWRRTIRLRGIVFDSRDYAFTPEKPRLPPPVWDGGSQFETGRDIDIEGLLVTSFLDFHDGRKDGDLLVRAFTTACQDYGDAVLLLKLTEPVGHWMRALHVCLSAQPRFACRIIAMRGPLADEDYDAVISASHWYASAANAEGLCLAMQDFLAAGKPAIAPAHTAFADYLTPANALIVASEEEPWTWPQQPAPEPWSWTQHPDDVGPTTAHHVSWTSLVAALRQAYTLTATAPQAYAALSAAAHAGLMHASSATGAASAVQSLLGQDGAIAASGPTPSPLLRELAGG